MRRGGRGSNLRGPWRRLDDPAIASAGYLNRGWAARNCVCIAVLAACSMAMSILIWSSRYRSNAHQLSSLGIVFPLYHYNRSGGHGMGRRENRAGRGRGIQGKADILMSMRGGHRVNVDDMEHFYVEMKLGVPPLKYNFHVDTGSGISWVYCKIRGVSSSMTDLAIPKIYVDSSKFQVAENNQSIQMVKSFVPAEVQMLEGLMMVTRMIGLKLCVIGEERMGSETLPLLTDGLLGLGNCKGTLLDQWTVSKSVRHSVLGVCLAKGVDWTALPSPATPVGYISMGMDLKRKFHKSNSVWSKLTNPGDSCVFVTHLNCLPEKRDVHSAVLIDTGSDVTFLATSAFEALSEALQVYASIGGYLRVPDNRLYVAEQQRVCWQPPDLILAKGSPLKDFPPLIFAFEGIDTASQRDEIQYLVVEPANYLIWDAPTKKLCLTILEDSTYDVSNIGADMMREHLFVYDFENQRVRWTYDKCKLD